VAHEAGAVVQGQQTKLALETVQRLRARDDLAQILGQKLGTGFVLLGRLPQKKVGHPMTVVNPSCRP
jgi:hypothetical protein